MYLRPKNPYRPFCSKACKNADFIHWAEEDYNIPGKEAQPEEIAKEMRKKIKLMINTCFN